MTAANPPAEALRAWLHCLRTYRDERGQPTRPEPHTYDERGICTNCGAERHGASPLDLLRLAQHPPQGSA